MIRNIIFDFGDVFINLDKLVVTRAMAAYDLKSSALDFDALNNAYETGRVSSRYFLDTLNSKFNGPGQEKLKDIWNSMLLDFPDYRLEFIAGLKSAGQYRLFLLSNTNELHLSHVQKIMGPERFERFKNSFEQFYLSHEIGMRKPGQEIFEFVLHQNDLVATETLFIDDNLENTAAAAALNINTWHLNVGKEDIIDLKLKL